MLPWPCDASDFKPAIAEKSLVNELIPMLAGTLDEAPGAVVVLVDVLVPLLPQAARTRLPATAVATPMVRFHAFPLVLTLMNGSLCCRSRCHIAPVRGLSATEGP